MIARTIFRLNVWQIGQSCLFQLRWGQGPELSAELEYHLELTTHYQNWHQLYEQCYYLKLRARPLSSGGVNPSPGDLHHQLEEARKNLLGAFQKWLGQLREIREKIRDQTHPAAQKSGESGETPVSYQSVDIFLACNSDTLSKLPWEAWELAPPGAPAGTIRLARIPMQTEEENLQSAQERLRKKNRILVILGDDTGLDLDKDRNAVELLKNLAQVELFDSRQRGTTKLKTELAAKIEDELGWNALFFVGHSDEKTRDGEFALAPDTILTIKEIEKPLTIAKKQGLQFCLFNSCSGLKIANSLANLGLQAVVMREKIHDNVAHVFLQEFCQHLKQQKDVHDAMLAARQHLQSNEKFTYPSAYLIPSFFSPYGAEPFRLEPFGWKPRLRQWLPTRGEAIALTTVLFFSVMSPVQDLLLDSRTFMQAVYRHITNQLPAPKKPPVLLIAIDQESINRDGAKIDGFQSMPMDREYLGKLVKRLSDLKTKTVGIDYLLDIPGTKSEKLAKPIEDAIKQDTWFVFGTKRNVSLTMRFFNPKWSLQADTSFLFGDIKIATDATCPQPGLCPFAYLLALSHLLNQQPKATAVLHPTLANQQDFQEQVNQYLSQSQPKNSGLAILKNAYPPPFIRSISDFSIPPDFAYQRLPAWKFLSLDFPNPELQKQLQQQVVIIAAGGYEDAFWDNHSLPKARQFWCHFPVREFPEEDCPESFTGGEIHAYMIYHLLLQHRVLLLPDIGIIIICLCLAKGNIIILLKQPPKQRQRWAIVWLGITGVYSIINLQLYISAKLIIPWLLPSGLFWFCLFLVLRRKSYA